MPRRLLRPITATLLALVVALGLVACSGGSGGGEDLTADLGPRQLLDRAAAEAAKLESFRIALDGEGRVDLAVDPSAPSANLLNGPLAVSGEGPVQPPDRASIDARVELASFAPQVNLTRVGDGVFVGILGQDFRLNLPAEQVALFDFSALFPTLSRWMTEPVEAGREEIDGTPTVKVTGGVDAVAAFGDLAPLLQAGSPAANRKDLEAALKEGVVEAWIGTEDLRPRRIHILLKADGTGVVNGVGAIDLDLTVTLSAFDEPVDISAPRNPRELDLNQLGSFTGG